jgi:hypothetical protein
VHLAIEHQHLSLLECLIEKNADLCIKNKNHQTPLELAYQKNDLKILTLLIQGGAYQIEFKSLHPIFVSHYVSQFFAYILDQVLPKNTPFDLIKEILQYVLDDKDFRNVDDFFRQVKNFHKKEFACTESFNTVLPPTLMRNFLFAARRGDRGDQINPCHSHAGGNRFP